ncbi:hypothetical protein NUH86_18160 [Sphingobium sp. JS3065]|uniref:hypothetical protein n=1 Tax=Sphingobium sp. JS3065 TaxID=2970925 RepID=UPI0022640151|nr:hypothetical protein [Sphingobium sp. JS3065]UZW57506.1 hypothetical protein NUH86_18160 [Sphingobium sp. JS3065]
MLTPLDESLLHQCALPMAHAQTSDHRFFDRFVFGCIHPDGDLAIVAGMGVYKNMNVIDGFVFVQYQDRQYNVRFSRALHPIADPYGLRIGPLHLDTLRPFESVRLTLEHGDLPIACELDFSAVLPARLEKPHLARLDGRITNDYLRFHQLGKSSGWVDLNGARHPAEDWFSWRDHSWGVRPNVGGFEPFTGTASASGLPSASRGGAGTLVCYAGFWNGEIGGHFQFIDNGDGLRLYTDGEIVYPDGRHVEIATLTPRIRFHEGTRIIDFMEVTMGLADGSAIELEVDTLGRPFVYKGGGYNGGFADGRGHGVFRSESLLIEQDVYDVGHVENVAFADGSVGRPVHREQFARAMLGGRPGYAYAPCIVVGSHPRFGFE